MKYVDQIGSGAMIHMPSFIKVCSRIQKLIVGYTYRHTDSMTIHKPTFSFSN
jgi:hypothetical protein